MRPSSAFSRWFRRYRNVLLPVPDGPMMEMTFLVSDVSEASSQPPCRCAHRLQLLLALVHHLVRSLKYAAQLPVFLRKDRVTD